MSDLAADAFSLLSYLLFSPNSAANVSNPAPTYPKPPSPLDFFLVSVTLVGREEPPYLPLSCLEYRSSMTSTLSVDLRFFFPSPKSERRPSNPALRMQQKQKRSKRAIPARTPITIPAMAPALSPWPPLLEEVIGRELPLAVAGGVNDSVVVAETIAVVVEAVPLVPRNGALAADVNPVEVGKYVDV